MHVVYGSGLGGLDGFVECRHLIVVGLWIIGPLLHVLLHERPQVRIRFIAGVVPCAS